MSRPADEEVATIAPIWGTYTTDEQAGTVTHHRHDSLQPGDKGDLVRRYEFVGDRLVLRPPHSAMEVTWERITS